MWASSARSRCRRRRAPPQGARRQVGDAPASQKVGPNLTRICRDCGMALVRKPNSTRIDQMLMPPPTPVNQSVPGPVDRTGDASGIVEAEDRKHVVIAARAANESNAVFAVHERHARPADFLERVAVDRSDAAERELTFERQVAIRQAEDRPPREQLPIGQREVAAHVEDVPVEAGVTAKAVVRQLRRPFETQARLLSKAEAEQAVVEMPCVRAALPGPRHRARVERVSDDPGVDVLLGNERIRPEWLIVAKEAEVGRVRRAARADPTAPSRRTRCSGRPERSRRAVRPCCGSSPGTCS